MKIECVTGGPMPTNCYLLTDDKTGRTAVVDPGFWDARLKKAVEGKQVDWILLTHGHFDHIAGVAPLLEQTGAKVCIYEDDGSFPAEDRLNLATQAGFPPVSPFGIDRLLHDCDQITVGDLAVKVLHTPGHTRGGCCFLVEDALFSGDTLMQGSMGRTDFPTGDGRALIDSLGLLKELPGDYRVFPGHGGETTLEEERRYNPYMNAGAEPLWF